MKIDCSISPDLTKVKGDVSRLQSLGYDGARVAELTHDPFLPLTLAAEYSEDIDLIYHNTDNLKLNAKDCDTLQNQLLGLKHINDLRMSRVWDVFEELIKEGEIK